MSPSYVHVVCKSTTAVVIFKPTLIGNLPQELYIQYAVEGQDMTSIKVHMNDTNQAMEYTVNGLNPGRKYNFSILVGNLFGQTRSNQVKCLTDKCKFCFCKCVVNKSQQYTKLFNLLSLVDFDDFHKVKLKKIFPVYLCQRYLKLQVEIKKKQNNPVI